MAFGFLMPKEHSFFEFFERHAGHCVTAAERLVEMVGDLERAKELSVAIKDIEHEGDRITHQTVETLHKTFITPIDRDEIHRLISGLDDVLDHINAASQRIVIYELADITVEAKRLCNVLLKATRQVSEAVAGLRTMDRPMALFKCCVEINRLENEGDDALRAGMARLFKEHADHPVEIIKWKEIYEYLELATDATEDVANTIEGIVLEHG